MNEPSTTVGQNAKGDGQQHTMANVDKTPTKCSDLIPDTTKSIDPTSNMGRKSKE
jgi:hypothetical protein